MINFIKGLFVSTPKELNYLLNAYCKENSYLTLDDLKKRHKEYLFNAIRLIRRCIETQILNINTPGVIVFSLFERMLRQCLDYYHGISAIESTENLKEACQNFIDSYDGLVAELRTALGNRNWLLSDDLTTKKISGISWQALAQKAARNFDIKGHHVNVMVPYPKEDTDYIDDYAYILRALFPESARQYYSFYTSGLDSRIFASGQYLHTTKDRANIKPHSFDAVVVTHDNVFDDIRPRIKGTINYLKKDGVLILIGMSTDFKNLDLRRIANWLQDIHVYFHTDQTINGTFYDAEICIVVGRPKDPQHVSEFQNLLNIFTTHQDEETPYIFYGSGQEEKPVFASHDITEAEAIALLPNIHAVTKKLVSNLLPKTTVDTRRPLLPFSSGQLGLVLISGDINGSVQEEKTKCCHVVKGSSKQRDDVKTEILATNEDGGPTRIRRTKSVYASTNVNIVLPTGEFVELH